MRWQSKYLFRFKNCVDCNFKKRVILILSIFRSNNVEEGRLGYYEFSFGKDVSGERAKRLFTVDAEQGPDKCFKEVGFTIHFKLFISNISSVKSAAPGLVHFVIWPNEMLPCLNAF